MKGIVLLAAAAFIIIGAGAASGLDNKMKTLAVVGFVGKAEVKSGYKWKELNIDDTVSEKDIIRVPDQDGSLELASDDAVYDVEGGTVAAVGDIIKKQSKGNARNIDTSENFKVETSTANAAVRGGAGKPGMKPVLSPAELTNQFSFAVTGKFSGVITYSTNGLDWDNIGYGIRLPRKALIFVSGTNGSLELFFFDKSSTNIKGPADIKLKDILNAKINSK